MMLEVGYKLLAVVVQRFRKQRQTINNKRHPPPVVSRDVEGAPADVTTMTSHRQTTNSVSEQNLQCCNLALNYAVKMTRSLNVTIFRKNTTSLSFHNKDMISLIIFVLFVKAEVKQLKAAVESASNDHENAFRNITKTHEKCVRKRIGKV